MLEAFDVKEEGQNVVVGVQVGECSKGVMHQKKLLRVQESDVEIDVEEDIQDGEENLAKFQESTPAPEFNVEEVGQNEIFGSEMSDSSKDFKEGLVDLPFEDCNSDEDGETTKARKKIRRYV